MLQLQSNWLCPCVACTVPGRFQEQSLKGFRSGTGHLFYGGIIRPASYAYYFAVGLLLS